MSTVGIESFVPFTPIQTGIGNSPNLGSEGAIEESFEIILFQTPTPGSGENTASVAGQAGNNTGPSAVASSAVTTIQSDSSRLMADLANLFQSYGSSPQVSASTPGSGAIANAAAGSNAQINPPWSELQTDATAVVSDLSALLQSNNSTASPNSSAANSNLLEALQNDTANLVNDLAIFLEPNNQMAATTSATNSQNSTPSSPGAGIATTTSSVTVAASVGSPGSPTSTAAVDPTVIQPSGTQPNAVQDQPVEPTTPGATTPGASGAPTAPPSTSVRVSAVPSTGLTSGSTATTTDGSDASSTTAASTDNFDINAIGQQLSTLFASDIMQAVHAYSIVSAGPGGNTLTAA